MGIFKDKKGFTYTQKSCWFVNFEETKPQMLQKDKIKIIVVLILVITMGLTYSFVGKESGIMKSVSGASLIIWLLTLFFLNKKYK